MGDFNISEDGAIIRLSEKLREKIVFISHDTRDWQYANLLCALIEKASQGHLKTFCTSRSGDIGYGEEWYRDIMDNISKSVAIICLLTKNSVKKPWILFEAGLAKGRFPNRAIRALNIDANIKNSPFSNFQLCHLCICKCPIVCRCVKKEEKEVAELVKQIVQDNTTLIITNKDTLNVIEKAVKAFFKNLQKLKKNQITTKQGTKQT